MFLHYQLTTIILLLLQFLKCSKQTTYRNLFSFVSKEFTGQSFRVIHKTNAPSNIITTKRRIYRTTFGLEIKLKDDSEKKLAEKNKKLIGDKRLFGKFKDKIGVIGAYAVVVQCALVGITTIVYKNF